MERGGKECGIVAQIHAHEKGLRCVCFWYGLPCRHLLRAEARVANACSSVRSTWLTPNEGLLVVGTQFIVSPFCVFHPTFLF